MNWMRYTGLVLTSLALTACTGLLQPPGAHTVYDIGMPRASGQPPRLVPWRIEVSSPSWLASSSMQYRLDYLNAGARDAYSESRWAAHPGEMLERYLSAGLSKDAIDVSWCRLSLELDEFVQLFESVSDSYAQMTLRASLSAPRRGGAVARKTFEQRIPAPSADARGGVAAHREGVNELKLALTAWLDELSDDGEIAEQCEPGDRSALRRRR